MEHASNTPAMERRDQVMARIPASYRGGIHVTVLLLEAGFFMFAPLAWVQGMQWWDWLVVPASFAFANAVEWVVHKGPLHHPVWPRILYERHTLAHHAAFSHQDMAIHHWREVRFVLFPLFALPALMVAVVPVVAGMWWLGWTNGAALFVTAAAAYYLLYEVLHLTYHLPANHPVLRLPVVQGLMRHHTRHHHPRWMTRGNFNVSIPFMDWLMGTILKDPHDHG